MQIFRDCFFLDSTVFGEFFYGNELVWLFIKMLSNVIQ
ncbi:hypothetical protein NMS_2121 [Nonlabens marinus S1-08]|uniref:Uncharacterized protein n=1 Tax=Nonlabens marinus S1-08 TaxID=1454201 RepID=W8VSC1_9FLAO|nr:hypothetical protein NMS_2121 [Nonlabens marinus S1-08]